MRLKIIIIISLMMLSLVSFGWLISDSLSQLPPAPTSPQYLAGKRVWQQHGCVECHTLFGNGGYNATDLTHISNQRSESWLREFLTNPPVMAPHRRRRHPGLHQEEVENLLRYWRFIDQIPVLGWPPPVIQPGVRR